MSDMIPIVRRIAEASRRQPGHTDIPLVLNSHDLFGIELLLKWAAQGCAHENRSALAAELMDGARTIGRARTAAMHDENPRMKHAATFGWQE